MLRITKLADAEYLLRQVALGVEDYYMGSGEAPGVWQGGLAAELGLTGVVEADHLRALLLGRDPITDTEMLSARRPRTVTAFDVTFSAPQSVSLLWAFGSPEVVSVASIAHVEAVAVALDFLERRAGATRQVIDGKPQRISTGVAAATFVRRTSREGDPQLHSHCVVSNLGRRPDRTFAALDATPLYEWGRTAGSVYQEELRRCLTGHLGVEWGPDRNGCREMAGFEPGWLRTFSKRTVTIDEYRAGAGPENPDPKHRMWADEAASLATRPRKDGSLTPEVLRERWQAEADGIGMPAGHALEAQVRGRTIPTLRPQLEWDDLVDALIEPEEGLRARRARFNEAHVVEHIAALGAGRLTVEALEDQAEAFIASEHTVPLADRTGRTSPQYSTVNHLLLEERVLDLVGDLCATPVEAIPPSMVEEAIATEAPGLGTDQCDAVRALSAAGHPVMGLAATNQAAGELRQAGIETTTIARFTIDGAALPAGAVVVLDEISQVATSDAEIVLDAVAATPGAVLWCLGDPHQAQSVRTGGLGAELARLGGTGQIPAPELTENRRQLEPAERRALARYRSGLVATSQAIRREHGWEHDLGSPHATREALADAVMADIVRHGADGVVALAVSHADCEDLADRIRHRLRATGHLHGPELAGPAWGNGERRYATGNRLLVHGIVRSNGHRFHNGSVVTVTATPPRACWPLTATAFPSCSPGSSSKGAGPTAAPTAPMAGPAPSTASRAAPGRRSTSSARPPSSASLVTPARAARVTRPTPGTSPGCPRSTMAASSPTSAPPKRKSSTPSAASPTPASPSTTRSAEFNASSPSGPNCGPCSSSGRPTDARPSTRPKLPSSRPGKSCTGPTTASTTPGNRLDQFGPLSQLRSQGRKEKASTVDQIDRFTDDVLKAEAKIAGCERALEEFRPELDQRLQWDVDHLFPDSRLRTVDAELADLGQSPHQHLTCQASLLRRAPGEDQPAWLDRLAEVTQPPLPGRDPGAGIDLGR